MENLHAADVIFVASHSQGAVVATHLIDRLIEDGHILTARSVDTLARTAAAIAAGGTASVPAAQAQKVCLRRLLTLRSRRSLVLMGYPAHCRYAIEVFRYLRGVRVRSRG